ncbi:Ribulose bisphosphate carboxylase large chain [Didymosphaeria variabile]|uniref:Ribulose bisphosphate carboxylase large chain n=1 Tax=Didymosphaeria variabile TaxID=1932322 RepID=A0A9W8XEL4_9PLEO|nr:Ribulose bisphosphate carboxylase large chain [Didymosphaeria variabile]KAJ4347826.1 Ribulose bisphosphate carboxylase large chain [Didymosphaeria variabile]
MHLLSAPLLITKLWHPPPTFKIPSHSYNRRPADIPLHTFSSSARQRGSDAAHLLNDDDKESTRSSFDTPESDSDLSLWSDTGDLVDQLADQEDPLRIRLRDSLEGGTSSRPRRQQKRVRYESETRFNEKERGLRLEDIEIPDPGPRSISKAERILASIMAPGDGPSRIHGLHGKKLIYFTSVFVSLGVFLFGYDQGVMSGIITGIYFKDYFNQPTAAELGTMVAILEVGAFISSLLVGRIGDMLGRRRTIMWGSIIFVVGGALQTTATGMPMMLLGRIIAGLGVGTLSTIVPVYQSEISPPHNRGRLACIEFTGNITGYAASVWVDYFCSFIKNDWSWRVPLFMQCIMGGLLAAGSLLICESPRWLLDNDHDEEGIVVIANLYGKGDIHNQKARDEYREIKMNVLLQRQEGERSYGDMFKRYYKRVFIAMSAQALAQLNGINVISYYAPLVFEEAGWYGRQAILMTGINAITYLLSTIVPWYVIDTLGRRKILLSGAIAMAIPLRHIILPLSIRAKGASLSTATNWAFNWLVGEMTPILQEHIQWRLYLIHAFFCAVSFVIVWFIYPETANVRLEDMNSIFGDATSVQPTPQQLAEAESLFSGSARSPVPSLDIRRGAAESAIPGLDIDPPDNVDSLDSKPAKEGEKGEGIGGWISNIVKRNKGNGEGDSGGQYRQVGQDEEN